MSGQEKTFTFEADEDSTVPLWTQPVESASCSSLGSGYFKPGDQLPKIRELAVDLSMNFNTVNKAYLKLRQSDGFLKSVRGKGVFVTDLATQQGPGGSGEVEALLQDDLPARLSQPGAFLQTGSRLARCGRGPCA